MSQPDLDGQRQVIGHALIHHRGRDHLDLRRHQYVIQGAGRAPTGKSRQALHAAQARAANAGVRGKLALVAIEVAEYDRVRVVAELPQRIFDINPALPMTEKALVDLRAGDVVPVTLKLEPETVLRQTFDVAPESEPPASGC